MSVPDRQLSANFWLHEFPCWEHSTEGDVSRLRETVQRVLQPFRTFVQGWAPPGGSVAVIPTSWMRWRSGCTLRDGSHRHGGTVDFDAPALTDAQMRAGFSWGVRTLLPAGYLGRWIYEPRMEDAAGAKIQGRHIHASPIPDMVAAYGLDDIGAYIETAPGQYEPSAEWEGGGWGAGSGAYGDPIEIPGFHVAVPWPWGRWATIGVLGALAVEGIRRRRP